jgi:hypothetical protein
MDYEYRVLQPRPGEQMEDVEGEVHGAIVRNQRWERFMEVRMAAGPTVAIETLADADAGFRVSATWGSQSAHAEVIDLAGALEVADRLAYALYEIRRDGPKLRS